ncbi:MAG: glycosyltransferase family 2 protein [Fibrobacterota bacterium]
MEFSLVIPTKDRADLLERAVRSVFAQTLLPDEIIVVDDGSRDDTPAVAERLRGDSPVPLIICRNAVARGGSAARNRGIHAARGTFVAFLDDDDRWLPDKLARQQAVLHRTGADIVYCGSAVYDRQGRLLRTVFHGVPRLQNLAILLYSFPGITSTVVIRRSQLVQTLFDESLPMLQEYELYVRLIHRQRARIAAVHAPLVEYRAEGGNRLSGNLRCLGRASGKMLRLHGCSPAAFLQAVGLGGIFLQKLLRRSGG